MEKISIPGGRYRLLRELGRGSEGKVYLVVQESTFRFFAAKMIDKRGECYVREGIQIWKQLRSRDMPQIRDVYETENMIWIIMDYIEGITLTKWIRRYGHPSVFVGMLWMYRICTVLCYLHEQNPPVLFGDLKADNVMIRGKRPVLVDMGSLYLAGSKTKKTGTVSFLMEEKAYLTEEKRDLICMGLIARTLCKKEKGEMGRFVKRAISSGRDGFTSARECQSYLRRWLAAYICQWMCMVITAILLSIAGNTLWEKQKNEGREAAYQELLYEAQTKGEASYLDEGIALIPDNERAYLEQIDGYLEDCQFTKEEYADFLRQWEDEADNGKTRGQALSENPSGYAKVLYRMGLSCWYFYSQREGTYLAVQWFEKMQQLPEQLRRDSQVYIQLGKYRNKLEIYQRTGEEPDFFINYLKELDALKPDWEEVYFRAVAVREKALFLAHYMMELKREGVPEADITYQIDEVEKELMELKQEGGEETRKICMETEEVLPVLKEMEMRFFYER